MPEIILAEGVSRVPAADWNALVGDGSPFLEWEWLSALEEAGTVAAETGWLPRPLLAHEGDQLVAACPLYVKGHSEGEFVFDWGWADAAYRAGIEYYPKLLVGVPFTPVAGARLLTRPGVDRATWLQRLSLHLRELCRQNQFSSVHVNFCEKEELEPLQAAGFVPRLGFQYHWRNEGYTSFEDYLSRFRSKRRNQIRREMREIEEQGIEIEVLCGDEIPASLFPVLYEIYLATVENHPWGRRYLNLKLFELLHERFRHRLCVFVARHEGEVVAGTINVQKGDALYGRYWGAFRDIRHLHFNVCYYAPIDYCIRNGLTRFEPGAGGSYKQGRGFDARPTHSAHFLADPRLFSAVESYLEEEREEAAGAIRALGDQSALKPTLLTGQQGGGRRR